MKHTIVIGILLTLSLLFLSGCGSETQTNTDENLNVIEGSEQVVKEANVVDEITADATIVIQDAKLTPIEITIPMDNPTILVKNMEDIEQRISIPFYGANIDVNIPAGEEVVIEAKPQYEGRVAINLNNAQLGGVTVEK